MALQFLNDVVDDKDRHESNTYILIIAILKRESIGTSDK